jgi:hypothetical protein
MILQSLVSNFEVSSCFIPGWLHTTECFQSKYLVTYSICHYKANSQVYRVFPLYLALFQRGTLLPFVFIVCPRSANRLQSLYLYLLCSDLLPFTAPRKV